MGGILSKGSTGMGNLFSCFQEDPQDMPGQGLARTDNFRVGTMNNEFTSMINSLTAAQPQLYASEKEYAPKYNQLARERLRDTVTGGNGVPGIGQMYALALRSADPGQAQLMDQLTQTANSDLALGASIDPQLLRIAQQSVRGRTAGTLGATGGSGALKEALGVSEFANNLRTQRRGFAAGVSAMNDARYAGVPGAALGISGVSTGSLVNPATSATLLNSAYSENQQNNRTQAGLETQIGLKQADIWNGWFNAAAKAI